MGRKTFSAPIKIVAAASTDAILETATSGDSQTAGTSIVTGDGDLTTSVGGQIQYLPMWSKINITTNMSAVAQLVHGLANGHTWIPVPRAGSIIGVGADLSANITAGTLTVFATKNGTTVFQSANSATGVKTTRATQAKDVDTFVATDSIGIKVTTSANFAPTTLDGVFYVTVEL